MNAQAKLMNLITLDVQVRLYVPSTIDVDKSANTEEWVDATVGLFAELFGGATAYNARGGWYTNGRVVYEKVTVVESYTVTGTLDNAIDRVLEHARNMKSTLQQEAVAIEVAGKLHLI